jgi:hypothetical protein
MSASGHKQTLSAIVAQRQLQDVNRTLDDSKLKSRILIFIAQIQTSAFPDSGPSGHAKTKKTNGRKRPEAAG